MTDLSNTLLNRLANAAENCDRNNSAATGASCAVNTSVQLVSNDPGYLYGHRYAWAFVAALALGVGYFVGRHNP